ncbi:glycosyltransferase [Halomonas mongoliensis]|uniref:Glycosyltransferase n=1 Tax=Halomonas mongoliensis TaxID=321265 RepID=A0ABU1GIX4_9GAMM|nr:glycosyltransferase [Halomonas mongoliensis]MDR5891924.1 glycosyltransferase [Halomonas mongoliensis]
MKVVHIISGLGEGGAEATLYRLCLQDRANSHTVISMMDEGLYGERIRQTGARLVCLHMRPGRLSVSGLYRLWRLLRRERHDVVQTWMYHADLVGGVLARLAGVKRIFWGIRHSTLEPGKNSRSTILVARLCAWLSSLVPTSIICCAQNAAETHRQLGYCPDKLRVIPNGYDMELFPLSPARGQAWRQSLGIPSEVSLIGMIGRFNPQKDHYNFLCGLAGVTRARGNVAGVLVGDGLKESNAKLMAWVGELGLEKHLFLLGQRNDIPDILNALDLHVLSSSFGEGFPNVVAEAMACGTPCVATDVGDARLIIGEVGWVVPPRCSAALADAMAQALEEARHTPHIWHRRRLDCRQRIASHYSLGRMAEAYNRAWKSGCDSQALAVADRG